MKLTLVTKLRGNATYDEHRREGKARLQTPRTTNHELKHTAADSQAFLVVSVAVQRDTRQ